MKMNTLEKLYDCMANLSPRVELSETHNARAPADRTHAGNLSRPSLGAGVIELPFGKFSVFAFGIWSSWPCRLSFPQGKSARLMKRRPRAAIRLRGVRHNNLKNFDLDLPLGQAHRHHRSERFGQKFAGLRHALRRGPAPLHRDVFALRAPILRSHGQAAGGQHPGHSAGHRHRAAQRGQDHPLDRRDDDGDLRLHEAALAAHLAALLPAMRATRAQGFPAIDLGRHFRRRCSRK